MSLTQDSKQQRRFFYEQLMSHTNNVNEEKVRIYYHKMRFVCYLVIIFRSNIAKAVFELARYLTNSDSNHIKALDHCIKYLHATKYLIIHYSNSEDEKLSSQIQISSSNKEMKTSSHSNFNKTSSSNKESNNRKQIFRKIADTFFANDLDRKSAENSIFKFFDDMID
jgi:hypothetical protein